MRVRRSFLARHRLCHHAHLAAELELGGPEEVDLAPAAREDILLNLPAYPRCDRHGGRVCPAPPLEQSRPTHADEEQKPDWSALDKLDL